MRIVSYCSVVSCKNCCTATNPAPGISFFKFPTDPILKEKWIKATGRQDWTPVKNSTICSQHFDDDYFLLGKERKLSDGAIPTINVAVANDVIDLDDEDLSGLDEDDEIKCYDEDSNNQQNIDSETKIKSEDPIRFVVAQKIDLYKKKQEQQRNTIKVLNTKLHRLSKKVELQNKIINDLMEMYGLKASDITVLKNEIIKAGKSK